MAMIKCRECGREISSEAERCPQCGCPTQKAMQKAQERSENDKRLRASKELEEREKAIDMISEIFIGIGFVFWIVAFVKFNDLSDFQKEYFMELAFEYESEDCLDVIFWLLLGCVTDIAMIIGKFAKDRLRKEAKLATWKPFYASSRSGNTPVIQGTWACPKCGSTMKEHDLQCRDCGYYR